MHIDNNSSATVSSVFSCISCTLCRHIYGKFSVQNDQEAPEHICLLYIVILNMYYFKYCLFNSGCYSGKMTMKTGHVGSMNSLN